MQLKTPLKIITIVIIILTYIFLIQNTFAQNDELTNHIKINNNTIGHQILDKKDYKQINELNKILNQSIKNIENTPEFKKIKNKKYTQKDVEKIIKKIDITLKELNYTFKKTDTLKESLQKKQIDCDTASIIYLSIADNLNLPMYGAKAPNHFYIIWKDNNHKYNIETTTATIKSNNFYKKKFNIKKEQQNIYMIALNKTQILSKKYEYKAIEEYKQKNYKFSETYFKKALKQDKTNYNVYVNLGITQIKTQNFKAAKENLEQAQNINYQKKIEEQLKLLQNY